MIQRASARQIVLGFLLAGASCTRPSPVVVTRLVVGGFEGGAAIGLTQEDLERRLIARLEAARFVVLKDGAAAPEGVNGWTLKLTAGVLEPDAETEAGARVAVVLHLRRQGSREGFEVRAVGPTREPSRDVEAVQAAGRESLDAALGRVAREAKALIELEPVKDSAVIAHLKDSDDASRDAAVRLLVGRRNSAALPVLLERLRASDLDAVRGAVGLLVELRAPQSVNPMIEATRRQGPVVEREIVFAVGAIGGEDAEAYLDLVASGHDDPLVRASAEAALSELRAKRGKEGASK